MKQLLYVILAFSILAFSACSTGDEQSKRSAKRESRTSSIEYRDLFVVWNDGRDTTFHIDGVVWGHDGYMSTDLLGGGEISISYSQMRYFTITEKSGTSPIAPKPPNH